MRHIAIALATALVVFSSLAFGQPIQYEASAAREHYKRGTSLFDQGKYNEAIVAFQQAYEIKDDPVLLYNIAQSFRLAGKHLEALRFYRTYIRRAPKAPNRDEVETKIADMERLIADTQKTAAIPAPPLREAVPKPPPNPDSDGDGIGNEADECKTVPAGPHPDKRPEYRGCPIRDRDEDTVLDHLDACPDQRGAPDPDPSKNGCPGLVEIRAGMIMTLSPIRFARGKETILPRSFPVLGAVANALIARQDISLVCIEGHTNNRGNAGKNLGLSLKRAQTVGQYLVEIMGVPSGRLMMAGFGSTKPMLPNTTKAGRAANERIGFRIVEPAR